MNRAPAALREGAILALSGARLRVRAVQQRNWSRIAVGEPLEAGSGEPLFLKQFVTAAGRSLPEVMAAEVEGAALLRDVLAGEDVTVSSPVADDPELGLLAFPLHAGMRTPDELIRDPGRPVEAWWPRVEDALVAVAGRMEAAGWSSKGLDVRNLGLTDGGVVLFDPGKPTVAPAGTATARLLVSVGLLNWGRPLRRFVGGPPTDLLRRATRRLAATVDLGRVREETATQLRTRRADPQAARRATVAVKRVGIAVVGPGYVARLERTISRALDPPGGT